MGPKVDSHVARDADDIVASMGGDASPDALEEMANMIDLEAAKLDVGEKHARTIAVELRRRALRTRNT